MNRKYALLTGNALVASLLLASQTVQAQAPSIADKSSQKVPLRLSFFKNFGKEGNVKVFGAFDFSSKKVGIAAKSFDIEFLFSNGKAAPSIADSPAAQSALRFTTPYSSLELHPRTR